MEKPARIAATLALGMKARKNAIVYSRAENGMVKAATHQEIVMIGSTGAMNPMKTVPARSKEKDVKRSQESNTAT